MARGASGGAGAEVDLTLVTMAFDATDPAALQAVLARYDWGPLADKLDAVWRAVAVQTSRTITAEKTRSRQQTV